MPSELRFDNRVAVVTGAGGSLGSTYAKLFASRGAKVVVNDVFKQSADKTVAAIKSAGGQAIANYDDVAAGANLIKQTIDTYGRVDILILNAGILRDKSFKAMSDKEFEDIYQVHLKGAFLLAKAAWPHMRKQKYGRIITTSSPAGLYGNFGQANYSAAKMGLTSFAKTLAYEGQKYNIHANSIAPIAASAMTQTVMPEEILKQISPDTISPFVAYLCHDSCKETGSIIELCAGWASKTKWQHSKGYIFNADSSFTPSAVQAKWPQVADYTNGPLTDKVGDVDSEKMFQASHSNGPPNQQGEKIDFTGQVILVTGAGNGVGRDYALLYASLGGQVVVNDMNQKAADSVVQEIKSKGGKAVANYDSVEKGQSLVDTALKSFGGIHVVINNAGILRDKSMASMTEQEWEIVNRVHLFGTYAVCKAAWPHLVKQGYGRIVNTASIVGVHGQFGQANYATAKAATIGFTKTLAIEGKKYNILANTCLPTAGSQLTATVWNDEQVKKWKPSFNAPATVFLSSKNNKNVSGEVFSPTAGHVCIYRWLRTGGYIFAGPDSPTIEDVESHWSDITRYDDKAEPGAPLRQKMQDIFQAKAKAAGGFNKAASPAAAADDQDSDIVKKAKAGKQGTADFNYTERDSILYNIGIGANEQELKYVFEQDPNFMVLPTFAVISPFDAGNAVPLNWLPNYDFKKLLHGEQYLELHKPLPTSGSFVNKARIEEVQDKGKAAVVVRVVDTFDKKTGEHVFTNRSTVFIRGAGGFGGRKSGKDYGAATAANNPPSRQADRTVELKTKPEQAAIYRLSGDVNPLHISKDIAKFGGFDQPILHGLCSFGVVGKHIYETYGRFKDYKVRFAGVLYPGETLVVSSWKEGNKVILTAKCKERNTPVLANAAVTLA